MRAAPGWNDAHTSRGRGQSRGRLDQRGTWAAGPLGRLRAPEPIRLVRSTHIVIANLFESGQAYFLRNPRHRIVLAIQVQEHLTLIGAFDVLLTGPLHHVAITSAATAYLCESINPYCKQPIRPEYALWSYSGVRSLCADGPSDASAITRDYLRDQAWAATVQDILCRRAKLGLWLTPPEVARLDIHLTSERANASPCEDHDHDTREQRQMRRRD